MQTQPNRAAAIWLLPGGPCDQGGFLSPRVDQSGGQVGLLVALKQTGPHRLSAPEPLVPAT